MDKTGLSGMIHGKGYCSNMIYSYLHRYSSVLRITGPDANSFLQGQFSNDISAEPPAVRYGLWLNHKGKVQGDSFLLRLGVEEHVALSYFSGSAELRARLESFVIADDVTVSDETDRWHGGSFWGEGMADVLGRLRVAPPGSGHFSRQDGVIAFTGRRSAAGSVDLLIPDGELSRIQAAAAAGGAVAVDGAAAERERIGSMIPAVPTDLGPNDLPAEGGLDAAAISFTKGCFLGQEVIARLKNLGQVRRQLVAVSGPRTLQPGAALFQGDTRVGEVRSTAVDGDGAIAFAMLSLVSWSRSTGLGLEPGGPVVVNARQP